MSSEGVVAIFVYIREIFSVRAQYHRNNKFDPGPLANPFSNKSTGFPPSNDFELINRLL